MKAKRTVSATKEPSAVGRTIDMDALEELMRDLEVVELAIEGVAAIAQDSTVKARSMNHIAHSLWKVREGIAEAVGLPL